MLENQTLSSAEEVIIEARISKTKRAEFHNMVSKYLLQRTNLMCLFVLIDSRHPPQAIDQEFMQWQKHQSFFGEWVFHNMCMEHKMLSH